MRTLLPLAAVLFVALAAPAVAQEDGGLEHDVLQARDGTEIAVSFGHIDVPENRNAPGSRVIRLGYMRVAGTVEDGVPVFVLAGGPGGSSIEMVGKHLVGGGQMFREMLGGDIIAFDQRGVGMSEPNLDSETMFELPLDQPGDRATLLAHMQATCREEAARWRAQGVDLAGYTTEESADDIDALCEQLGFDKVSLWGESYGSHLALATLRRHEDRVHRLVLVGPEGPDHTIKLPSYPQENLERVAEMVAADPEFGESLPDLVGMLERALARLEAEPSFVELDGVRVGISKFDAQWVLANMLGQVRGGIDRIPAIVLAMSEGDDRLLAQEVVEHRQEFGIWTAMRWIMDGASGISNGRASRIAKEARRCVFEDVMDFPFPHITEAWGAPDLGSRFRGKLKSEVPVLFITGDLDCRTPVRNAEELMRHLPNSHLIVVENAGHDLNWVQEELREAWPAFLRGEELSVTRVTAPEVRFLPR